MTATEIKEEIFLRDVAQNAPRFMWLLGALVYSQVFAEVVKQAPEIVNDVYDYRYFM